MMLSVLTGLLTLSPCQMMVHGMQFATAHGMLMFWLVPLVRLRAQQRAPVSAVASTSATLPSSPSEVCAHALSQCSTLLSTAAHFALSYVVQREMSTRMNAVRAGTRLLSK